MGEADRQPPAESVPKGARSNRRGGPNAGTAIALGATLVIGVLTLWSYASAVSEGMDWHRRSQLELIAPDYQAHDSRDAKQVPDFELKDRFGNAVRLSQFAELDLILINIWSSGCRTCLEEVPALTEMDRRIGEVGKAALITIAVEEKWEDVAHYFPRGTDLRVLFDPKDEVARGIFGTKAYPETFVLDKQRRIRARFDGKRPWHSPVMFEYFASFI